MNQSKNIVMATLFLRKELSFANNALASMVSCISYITGMLVPKIYESKGLLSAFYFGVILCSFSALVPILILLILSRASKQVEKEETLNKTNPSFRRTTGGSNFNQFVVV